MIRTTAAYIRMWWRRIKARKLTAASFERAYARRGHPVTLETLHEHGRYAKPCDCGVGGCDGWQMAHRSDTDFSA